MDIAIDTSVLVAVLVPNDLWHSQAIGILETIETTGHVAIYLDCVAAEAVSTTTRRLQEKNRSAEVPTLLAELNRRVPADRITWILPEVPRLYPGVLDLIRSASGALNFNDALIALACRERGNPAIASFHADVDSVAWLRRLGRAEDVNPQTATDQQ